jgi:hypothetical protein
MGSWITVAEYLCHNPVLSSFRTYDLVCNKSNTTGATSGAGTADPLTNDGALELLRDL